MALLWGALFALVYGLVRKHLAMPAIAGALVVSHWFLDWVVPPARPPAVSGRSNAARPGLWDSLTGSLSVELALFVAGIVLFLRATRAPRSVRRPSVSGCSSRCWR
jgi:hypothetical protein